MYVSLYIYHTHTQIYKLDRHREGERAKREMGELSRVEENQGKNVASRGAEKMEKRGKRKREGR